MPTAREDLEQLLLRQKELHVSAPQADPLELRREWIEELEDLFRHVDGWLDQVAPDLLRVEPIEVPLDEYRLGPYRAPARRVQAPNGRFVEIVPHGRLIEGAIGRVDLLAPPLRAMLLRFDPRKWHFLTSSINAAEVRTEPLTEEAFLGVLKELLA